MSRAPDLDPKAMAALPQTRDRPKPDGALIEARAAALWAAIVEDAPEKAMPFFFPLGAYAQVKAIAYPENDWKNRLVHAFERDIHTLHGRYVGATKGKSAKFLGLRLPDDRARWVEPNEEYNKIGYFRVFGSQLRFEVDGQERSFEIKSLISWRGEWFVVHMLGFK